MMSKRRHAYGVRSQCVLSQLRGDEKLTGRFGVGWAGWFDGG